MRFSLNSSLAQATTSYKFSFIKKIQHIIEAICVVVIIFPLKLLGHKNNVRIYRFVFSLLAHIPFCKERALKNLEYAYPDMTQYEKSRLVIRSWENLGNVAADFIFTHYLLNHKEHITLEGAEILQQLKESNQNALFFSGHIATWEIFRIAAHHHGFDVAMVYRAFNNPYFDAVARYLMDYGFAPIFQKGNVGVKQMMRYIRSGGNILILTDQRFSSGVDIPFFGKNAKTAPSVAEISLKYNLPLIPVFVRRDGLGKFIVTIQKPLEIDNKDKKLSRKEKLNIILSDMNNILEKHIRIFPEEWFWLHRRWKS